MLVKVFKIFFMNLYPYSVRYREYLIHFCTFMIEVEKYRQEFPVKPTYESYVFSLNF